MTRFRDSLFSGNPVVFFPSNAYTYRPGKTLTFSNAIVPFIFFLFRLPRNTCRGLIAYLLYYTITILRRIVCARAIKTQDVLGRVFVDFQFVMRNYKTSNETSRVYSVVRYYHVFCCFLFHIH